MRQYRVFKSTNWGPHYSPVTKAHHCEADDARSAAEILKPSGADGFQTMQVLLGSDWEWVTETPEYLGGIAHPSGGDRHGE